MNIYDDLSFKDIKDNGAFKIATGNGLIPGEKKFGEQFQFNNYSKLTFACNKIPNVKDVDDEAYFGRWIVIKFNRQVTTINKFLVDEISTPEELSGLLNFAIEGLRRILDSQNFSYIRSSDEIREEMLRSGSPIAIFAQDCLEEDTGSWMSKDDIYEHYVDFSRHYGYAIVPINDFGRKIRMYANYVLDSSHKINSQSYTGWRNVKLKNDSEEDQAEKNFENFGNLESQDPP